ncbi:hypothetical protein WKW79_22905 [Variovorax robiniae]|uniref:Integrase catalytic domain-containing protein n=1 Tax=Variovorax robiniae TaxID=1836199 RepID=A0ABU8XC69_9BURK
MSALRKFTTQMQPAPAPTLQAAHIDQGHVPSAEQRRQIENLAFNLRLKAPARDYLRKCIAAPHTPEGVLDDRSTVFLDPRSGVQLVIPKWMGTFATILASDPRTVFIFAFPGPVPLTFHNAAGIATTGNLYQPHFLVVRKTEIVVFRVTRRAKFLVAMKRSPSHYFRDKEGRMRFAPAEQFYADYGFGHELIDETCVSRQLAENTRFLERFRRPGAFELEPKVVQRLLGAVQPQGLMAFHHLLKDGFSANEIFKAVADGVVYVDLSKDLLDLSDSLVIYSNESAYQTLHAVAAELLQPPPPYPGFRIQPGTEIEYDGQRHFVLLQGERDVTLRDAAGDLLVMPQSDLQLLKREGLLTVIESANSQLATALTRCTPAEIERALASRQELYEWKAGRGAQHSERTMRRRASAVQSARNSAEELFLLLDHMRKRGNRTDRFTPFEERLIKRAIGAFYNQPHKPTAKGAYAMYVQLHQRSQAKKPDMPVRRISEVSFGKRCQPPENHSRRLTDSEKYQLRAVIPSTDLTLTYHGVIPHGVCYVDHTTVPIVLIAPDGTKLNKPTLTLAYDAAVKRERAMILLPQAPSLLIVFMLLRDYVRRNGCLPRVLSFDHGSELLTPDVRAFCKIYRIEAVYRKPKEPRNGAPVESRFAAAMTYIANMKGNTLAFRRDVRMVDKKRDPFQNDSAEWTLPGCYWALEWYFFEYHPKMVKDGDLGMTPEEFEAKRYRETGGKEMLEPFELDQNMLLATSPHPKKKWYRVIDAQRGVNENGKYHWHPSFATSGGKLAEVRLEIWMDRLIYCRIEGNPWVAALSDSYLRQPFETAHEANVQARYQRAVNKLGARQSRMAPEVLCRLAATYDPKKFDARLTMQANESIYLYRQLGLTTLPVWPSDTHEGIVLPCVEITAAGTEASGLTREEAANDQAADVSIAPSAQTDDLPLAAGEIEEPNLENDDDDDDDENDGDDSLELRDFF